jgi:hypothetical protein
VFENPFHAPGRWYRANLHAHTTLSDGDIEPADCAELYRSLGYDILAITDHWQACELESERPDFLLLRGVELNGGRAAQGTQFHLVGLNVSLRGRLERKDGVGAQDLVDMMREAGGEVLVAHPYWSGLMAPDIAPLEGCLAVEVYNTGCDLEILRGFSMTQWDDLLALGHDFGAVAVDDGHRHKVDHGLGWTMVKAEELSAEAVMEALRRGRYYASIGPRIEEITLEEGRIRVTCSPVSSIALVSVPGYGARAMAPPGEQITSAEFTVPSSPYWGSLYWRVEITDAAGKSAWSNPCGRSSRQPLPRPQSP